MNSDLLDVFLAAREDLVQRLIHKILVCLVSVELSTQISIENNQSIGFLIMSNHLG